MQKQHVAALLGLMATFDYRKTDETDDDAWLMVIGDLNFDDAKAAVIEHYEASDERMKPVDVRRGVAALREQRARHQGAAVGAGGTAEIPDADPDDVPAYLAAVREQRVRCGDQLTSRPVGALLAGRSFRTVPPVTQIELARERRALPGGDR
jgi:hypothetical protein